MAASARSEDGEIGFQIAPMVDVVFVLMLFFLACAGMQVKEKELGILLPGGEHAQPDRFPVEAMIIEISPEGQVVANGQAFGTVTDKTLSPLRDWLKAVRGFGGQEQVYIRPAATTRHERIMDVLNACRASGIENLKFL